MHKTSLRSLLNQYQSSAHLFPEEKKFIQDTIDFIWNTSIPLSRKNLSGHITNSAWVIDRENKKVLLIESKKFQRWFQPGGHHEESDISLQEWAKREAQEETGIENISLLQTEIFDIDVHTIPEKWTEPEHLHYDIRFIFEASSLNQGNIDPKEISNSQWIPLENIEIFSSSPSLLRMWEKTKYFFQKKAP